MQARGYLIAHIIPLRFFDSRNDAIDVFELASRRDSKFGLLLLEAMFNSRTCNSASQLDHNGWLQTEDSFGEGKNDRYLRVFPFGCVEVVEGRLFSDKDAFGGSADKIFFPDVGNFENFGAYLGRLSIYIRDHGVDPPYACIATIGGCSGVFVSTDLHRDNPSRDQQRGRILTNRILFGPVNVNDVPQARLGHPLARGIMDQVWQAAGKRHRPSKMY